VPRPWFFIVGFVALDPWELVPVINVVYKIADQVNHIVLSQTPSQEKQRVTQLVFLFKLNNGGPVLFSQMGNSVEEGTCNKSCKD
jgi:hypothetical protein